MAANTDKLRKKKSLYSTTLTAGIDAVTTTIPLLSTSGLPTDTAITLTIDRVNGSGVATPLLVERVTGVISGNNLTNALRGQDGTSAQSHDNNAVVEDTWDADTWNDAVDTILVGHEQDGTHKDDSIPTDAIEDSAITTAKLNDAGITSAKLDSNIAGGWIAAGETWTYASASDPSFTLTISGDKTTKYSAGMKIKLTQTTDKFFIITKSEYSDPNTTLTIYGGTDYDLANAAITTPFYSSSKSPAGFPMSPNKWTVSVTDVTDRSQATPGAGTWYNLGTSSIAVPIGSWRIGYKCSVYTQKTTATFSDVRTTVSTANNSESNADFTTYTGVGGGSGTVQVYTPIQNELVIDVTSAGTYYMNIGTPNAGISEIGIKNSYNKLILYAISAYL